MLNKPFISLFTDFGFKKIFGSKQNKDILIDLLNTLFAQFLKYDTIIDVQYLKNDQQGKDTKDRTAIFDLHCKTERGFLFIVELQRVKQIFFKDRSLFYASYALQEQGEKGEWNYRLTPVFVVCFLNFLLNDQNQNPDKAISHIQLMDTETHEIFYDKLTFVYVEMPKFKKQPHELTTNLDKWLYLFQNMGNFDKIPPEADNQIFLKLFAQCEIAKYKPKDRLMYEESWKRANDLFAVTEYATMEGREKGKEIGVEIGVGIGVEKQKRIGVKKGVEKGFSNELISELNDISIAEVEKIRKELGI